MNLSPLFFMFHDYIFCLVTESEPIQSDCTSLLVGNVSTGIVLVILLAVLIILATLFLCCKRR